MQYNKRNIQKVSDKKLMRKVKKQWVVLSVAAFASLGASAFWMLNSDEVSANDADTTPQAVSHTNNANSVGRQAHATPTTNQLTTANPSSGNGSQSTANLGDNKTVGATQPVSGSDKAQSDFNNGKKGTSNTNSDYTNTYSNSTQGFKDAMKNDQKNIVQSQNNNTQTNPNPQKSTQGYQNGVNQYNQYRSAMNAGASDAYNGTSNPASQISDQDKNYYTAAYNGSSDAKKAYNNATQNEGTDNTSYTSYNQWLKDNGGSQTDTPSNNNANAKAYKNNVDSNYNTANNVSVKTNSGNIQVTNGGDLSQASNQTVYQSNNNYPNDSVYALAYQYGYNYFLANQGAADAKSGKWNGKKSNGYNPSSTSTNPYDQSYLGAQAAINQQVQNTQSGNSSISITQSSGVNNAFYQSAYNDVTNDSNQGIVYIQNFNQMNNILTNNMNGVTALKLVTDIGTTDSSYQYPGNTDKINSSRLDIDGQNHILDTGMKSYELTPSKPGVSVMVHNFKTLYGENYYGPFGFDNSGSDVNAKTYSLTYANTNYVGSKLISSYESNVYINGNVNVSQLDVYTSPFNNSVSTQTDGSYGNGGNYQPGLQVGNMTLGANSNYFGSSASQTGSQNIQVNGKLTLGKNSNMTLVPTGAAEGQDSPDHVNNYGVYLKSSNSSLNVNEGSSLNIFLNNSYGNKVSGIYNNGTITTNGGKINAESNSSFSNNTNQMIYSNGEIDATNGGKINIKVSGLGTTNSSGIINNKNNMNISNRGNLNVQDMDNSGGAVTLVGGKPINVYNVGSDGVSLINNNNAGSQFVNGGINGYTVVVSDNKDNSNANAYYSVKLNANGNGSGTNKDGQTSDVKTNTNTLYINSVPSVSFVGPVYTSQENGKTVIHAYAKIDQYSKDAKQLYIQYASGNGNTSYQQLTPFAGQTIQNKYSGIDTNGYYVGQDVSDNTGLIPLNFTVPDGTSASNYGIRLRYGVSGVNAVVSNNNDGTQSYTTNNEGYSKDASGNYVENDVQAASGNVSKINNGFSDGISDAESGNDNAKNPASYQKDLDYTNAYDNAKAGYKQYLDNPKGTVNVPNNATDPSAFSQGYDKAKNEYQDGYNNSVNNYNVKSQPNPSATVAQKAGFNKGQEAVQGIQDAQNKPGQGDSYQGTDDQKDAYQAASAAIQDGMNNKAQPNDLNSKSQAYQAAYKKAYADSQAQAQKIAKNGGKTDGIDLTPAQQAAQQQVQNKMNQATTDAASNDHSKDNNYEGNTNVDNTYKGAQDGFANGGTGAPKSGDQTYINAFNNAQAKAKAAAAAGASQYTNGQTNKTTESTAAEKAADNYGYQQAQKGYEAAKMNQADNQNNDPSYQAGVKMNTDVNNGANDANNATSKDPNYANNHNTAQTAGYNGTLDGGQAGMNGDPLPADLDTKPQAYQDAYKKAHTNGENIAAQIAAGTVKPNTLSPAQQAAYNNSPQAVAKASDAAKNPSTDSDNQYNGTDNASRAYQAAKAGYENGGTNTMSQAQQKDPIYSKAFSDAQKSAQAAAQKGAQNYVNGSNTNNPNEQTVAEKAANNYGYQQAQKGYEAAKTNQADNQNNDPSYQAGVKMNTDVNNGASDANNATSKDPNYANNHNAAQTAGYNGTLDGGQAGMNGDPVPADLNTKPQAYQDAYNKAYQDSQQKAQQIAEAIAKGDTVDTSKLTPAQKQAYQAAQTAIDNAKSAAADNNPSTNDSKYNGTDNASRAYKAAKAGYENGGTNTMSPNEQNDPIYSKAFSDAQKAAQAAAKNGAQNYANGNNTNIPTENTQAEKAADAYGYQQAQAGYDAQRTGHVDNNKNNTDPSYQAGVQVAKDVSKGSQEAAQSNNADSNAPSTGSSAEKDAYQATKEAYQAAMNGTGEPGNSDKSQAYRDAYDSAYQDAKKQADAINNGNITSDRLTPGQKAAYDQAQNAMNTAIDDAKNNPDTNNDKYNGTDNASKAYQAAKAGYANAGNNTMDPKYADDPVYRNEFNQAQSDAKAQAAKAVKDFADGKGNSNVNGKDALSKAYTQGYNAMEAGYNANPADPSNNDPSYQAGVQMAKDAKAGTTDAYDNPKQGSSYQGSLAKQEAYQATVEANQAASSGKPMSKPDPSDFTRNSRAYQDAYKQAYNHAEQMTKAAAAGQIDKNNLDNQLDRDSYNQGINASQAGYQAAQSGDSSNDSKYNGKGIADLAYQGAHDGFNNGTKDSGSPASEDPVYLNAYNNAHDAARKYAKSGAQDFAQGKFKNSGATDPDENDDPNKQDALNKAHDYGYNQAQKGYDDQQANKDKDLTNNGTPEYNVGAKMARDSNLGKQFALTGTGDSIANSDIAQRDGYQATISGYQDGANGHKQNVDGHSQAYKDAYEQAYENGQKLAQQGASGKTGDNDLLKNNVPGQKAYAQGISDANNGYQAAASQNGINDDGQHNDTNNSNTDKAYQGALAGFKDGGNGVKQPNNSDPVYTKAYNDANQVAQSAIQAGVNEFAHGDDSSTTNGRNDPISMAHNEGFDQAKQGYQAQMSGKADPSNNNPGYLAGVKMADQYQKAIDNTNNNPGQDGNNDPVSQATRAGTLAGYSDSIHNAKESNIPSQYQNQSKAYQDAYTKAHQEAINNLKAGAEAFNNDNVAPTGNDITSMAKEQGFAAAQDAYKKAQQNSTVTPQSTDGSNYSETYNGASTAFNNALNGNYDQPYSSSDVYNSAYNKAMKEAKQLISDAAMNSIKNQKGTSISSLSNDMISQLSNLGLNDASKAYQAAQNQEPSYTSKDPNAIDVYNGAKAALDDINNGHANANRNGSPLYQASYDKALQDAQSFAQKGADGYSNGQKVNDVLNGINNPTAAEKAAIQNGYNQANAGHDDSMNGIQEPKQDNPYYNYEFNNSAKSTRDGAQAAMNDATQGPQRNGDNKLDQAYNGTVDAYKDAGQSSRDISHMPMAYRDAYKQAQADAQKAYENGVNQFNNDQPNDQANNHGAASIAHNNGYQAAQSIYNQVLQDPKSVDPSNLNPAQKVGYDKAQQSIAGLQDYASGKQPTSTDNNYMSAYNAAKQATQAAMNDAKNGKPAQANNVPSGMNPQLYNDVYNATYSGYNNGFGGNSNKSNQGFAYNIAYQNAYKQGQYDIPVVPMPQKKNANKPNRNSNKAAKNYANVDQNTNKGILDAINGHKMKFGSTRPYKDGYNLGKEALKGMRAAEYGRKGKQHIKNAKDSFYMFGYNGYKNGVRAAKRTLKANKRLSKHDLAGKSQAYIYTFKQGLKAERRHQHNLGYKQGVAMAKKVHAIPARLSMTHSAQYVESYIKAYKRTMKHNMPKYVYNVRTIFVHKQLRFTNKNRVVRYVKMPRNQAKLLRVTGIAYYKNGTPRYRVVGGGMVADKRGTGIVAANDSIVNAYYRHNFNYFRVIKPKGTLTYKGMKFVKDNASHKVYHGEIFKVDKVVRYHGLTRFYLGHGQYITSNKTIVQKVG
ncbi:DUF5776 domain-containing protein [Apilactobacillus micheneri]|uniref:DUF5776 domain-containing protein n=2 Tax=Apilactobacillus micheneri TaxID=1899430 RepID=UPI0011288C08|nr:DUF5776 domain-containing protein [Apilactobacillus micheneri]TPR37952.1 hypothetical protein DY116_01660 [Apilactobacillus micheneri]